MFKSSGGFIRTAPFTPKEFYRFGGAGYSFDPTNTALDKQTYNAPATAATAAGDPVGLMLPAQAPEAIVNLLVNTDNCSASSWTNATTTVTRSATDGPTGVFSFGDMLTSSDNVGNYNQVVVSGTGLTITHSRYWKRGGSNPATQLMFRDDAGAGRHITVNTTTGAITSTAGSLVAYGNVDVGGGWWRVYITFVNDDVTTRGVLRPDCGVGSWTYFCAGAQTQFGTLTAYQPNAGCLGGSNRRSGGNNLLKWTRENNNPAGWTPTRATISSGFAAPDGTLTAAKIVSDMTASNTHDTRQYLDKALVATTMTMWRIVKQGEWRYCGLEIYPSLTGSGYTRNYFDLQTGTVLTSVTSGTDFTWVAAGISDQGNGWYLCWMTFTTSAVPSQIVHTTNATNNATSMGTNGDGTSGIYIWDAGLVYGTSSNINTASRNLDQLGGLITNVPLYQTNTSNRVTLARWPAGGIKNYIPNNMMTGAVVGTPGTAPTGWTILSSIDGAAQNVTYVDRTTGTIRVRVVGTSGTGGNQVAFYLGTTEVGSAEPGDVWVLTCTMRLVSGSWTNIGSYNLRCTDQNQTSVGSFDLRALTATPQVVTVTSATFVAGATHVLAFIRSNWNDSLPIDFEIEITQPSLTKSGVSTTPIQQVVSPTDITESGQPYNYGYYGDGTSDTALTGLKAFGAATLCAQAGNAFTLFGYCRTLSKVRTIGPAQASATAASKTFQMYANTTTGYLTMNVRGTVSNLTTADLTDGNFHTFCITYDGTTMSVLVDSLAAQTPTIGTAAIEDQEIMLWARTLSSPAEFLPGHQGWGFLDRAASVTERAAVMANLNATYRPGL